MLALSVNLSLCLALNMELSFSVSFPLPSLIVSFQCGSFLWKSCKTCIYLCISDTLVVLCYFVSFLAPGSNLILVPFFVVSTENTVNMTLYPSAVLLVKTSTKHKITKTHTQNKSDKIQFLNCFWSLLEKSHEGWGWGRLSTSFGLRKLVYVDFMKASWILENYGGSSTVLENCNLILHRIAN